ncbi:TetR family transcriptional regulator [Dyadobacter frigoris]|uniref:Helix-turn-helix transcriptional regulator n=1 Tax=Dyadobacter frigoris TaxID=2576211 RepID=A0A4U6D8L5_9BACT|nr:TetR family transcriptional regulator [Dyadobacter frigoris]TKT92438.1 helix-turn-helix transcriptional regulator [Dyadobacter frigoris]
MINKETKPGQRILKAVSKLFDYQGYNATGVNQIVQESGYQH